MARNKPADTGPVKFSGRGIMFTVYDQSRDYFPGIKSTIEVVANAIDEAIEEGYDDPDSIARYLTTTAFKHVTDRVAKFNAIFKAGDVVGSNIIPKLFNGYYDLRKAVKLGETKRERELAEAEARGFAEAMTVMFSPFSVESSEHKNELDWEEVDYLTDLMEEQQEEARKER